ncbi:MerR family transcriptional regulator [Streptomyces griseoruber]|uniref:Transcriptional regulator n=1 Tax=Streptomyces griseoruber TaxID=1943 RepID=A0A124I2N4_9ACTN|nr:MerR family transcriptional regulator [Streptomyces griseoruber]KUN80699.1 transcriptional regulator [Streptomyces griseoruber]
MTIEPDEPPLTVDELAARAGVTVRTVRFYGTRGLLPPPVIGPRRVGHYGPEHLARLELIEELQRQGMTLAAIERYLGQLPPGLDAHDLAVHRAVVASWAPGTDEPVSGEELRRRAGRPLSEEDVRRLVAMDVVEAAADGGYRVDSGLLPLGVRLLDVPLSQEVILAARSTLIAHSRAAAQELSGLLREAVAERDAQDVRSLTAQMRPLVVQALLTTFQRSLRDELRLWLSEAQTGG